MREFLGYFLRLGTFGFGGPIVLACYTQRDLVEERKWISRPAFVGDGHAVVRAVRALGGLPWMQGLFYGVGAAVIAIIARSVVKLVK
jgi:chromate transporter